MNFVQKDSDDQYDSDTGIKKFERCHLCKWYIEKGHYLLEVPGCKHRLHKKCLEVWFLRNTDCPICKEVEAKKTIENTDYSSDDK